MAETELQGTLERITFSSEKTGWSVAKLRPDGAYESVSVVGEMFRVAPGERLRLVGEWTTDAQWGRQFRFRSYTSLVPATVEGIRKYLASGLVGGIGEEFASRLVARFGAKTLDIIEHQPEKLREVDGIGPKRAQGIVEAYGRGRAIRDVMVFLHSQGVSPHFAAKILKRYGDEAISVVRATPYRLAEDIHGIGFLSADRIAGNLGIAKDDPARAEAGLLHCLSESVSDGHVFVPSTSLKAVAAELLGVPEDGVATALAALRERSAVVLERLADGEEAVFLPRLHSAEVGVATILLALLESPPPPPPRGREALLREVEAAVGVELAPQQREAIEAALSARVLVVTGGPGTGKTTIVRGLLTLLQRLGHRVALAAPTGRASRRLQEAAAYPASTIHRMLEFTPRQGGFLRGESLPLDADAVIVDEASMLDIGLCHALLSALVPTARLLLVGDADQLPSVGPGTVLGDVIASRAVPVVRLTEVFRQSEKSAIVRNAHRIRKGQALEAPGHEGLSDFYAIEKERPEDILDIVKRMLAERIPSRFAMDPRRDVQVLAPMYRGVLGTDNLNRELQALLNPDGTPVAAGGGRFRIGDKVMQIRNDYDKDVFNGDLGLVTAYDDEERMLTVAFDGRPVVYESGDLDELVLAYAVSVHKSQGSEYPAVVVPLHTQHYLMLQRNLLYTAVTRGRRLVVLVGSRGAMRRAIENDQMAHRYTRLAERLRGVA